MNRFAPVFLALALSSAAANSPLSAAPDKDEPAVATAAASAEDAGVPILTLVRAVAKKTGKKIIVDSKVHGNVQLIGEEAGSVTYGELLTILQIQGFTAVEGGGFVRVIPEAIVRQSALPLVVGGATYPDAQYVAAVIPVHKVPAAGLVPILRPLLPQQAHFAAAICSNAVLMVDTYANVRRIESIIAALDTGDPYKADRCDSVPRPAVNREAQP
jgi:type II secretory pathway component GspD/PulD (secretin)